MGRWSLKGGALGPRPELRNRARWRRLVLGSPMRSIIIFAFTCLQAVHVCAYDFGPVTFFGRTNFLAPTGSCSVGSIAVDQAGNRFTAGVFRGTVAFGAETRTAQTNTAFISKITPSGDVGWVLTADGASSARVAADGIDALYVMLSYTPPVTFCGETFTNGGRALIRMNGAGQIAWHRTFPAGSAATVALAPNRQRLWVAGSTNPGVIVHSFEAATGEGGTAWTFNMSATINGLAVDSSTNIFLTGSFQGDSLSLGETNLPGRVPYGHYTANFTSTGSPVWGAVVSNRYESYGSSIAAGPDGSVVTVGTMSLPYLGAPYSTIFVLKNNADGTVAWQRTKGEHRGRAYGYSVRVDGQGNVYAVGSKEDSYLNSSPPAGPVLMAYTPAGTEAAFVRVVGPYQYQGSSGEGAFANLLVDGTGQLHLCGTMLRSLVFGENRVNAAEPSSFVVSLAPVMNPKLSAVVTGNSVQVTWPSAASGFRLQAADAVSGSSWVTVSDGVSTNTVVSASEQARYFRLVAP